MFFFCSHTRIRHDLPSYPRMCRSLRRFRRPREMRCYRSSMCLEGTDPVPHHPGGFPIDHAAKGAARSGGGRALVGSHETLGKMRSLSVSKSGRSGHTVFSGCKPVKE